VKKKPIQNHFFKHFSTEKCSLNNAIKTAVEPNNSLFQRPIKQLCNLNKRRARVGYEAVEVERPKLAQRAIDEGWRKQTYEQCMADF